MSEPVTVVSVEMAEDARAKAFEALLDAAEAYPARTTAVHVMQAALAYADAANCVEWVRDISRRIRRDVEVCERLQSSDGPPTGEEDR